MVCPSCMVQMHQKDQLGGGRSDDVIYETYEIKECPQCGRMVIEYYRCQKIMAPNVTPRFALLLEEE